MSHRDIHEHPWVLTHEVLQILDSPCQKHATSGSPWAWNTCSPIPTPQSLHHASQLPPKAHGEDTTCGCFTRWSRHVRLTMGRLTKSLSKKSCTTMTFSPCLSLRHISIAILRVIHNIQGVYRWRAARRLKSWTKRADMFLSLFRSGLVYLKIRGRISMKMCPSIFPAHQPQRYSPVGSHGTMEWIKRIQQE